MNNGSELYQFSDFVLDVQERLLTRNGERLQVPAKAFEVLCVLVRHSGHLVTKEDLLREVWGETCVEENNLDKNVSRIRQILGGSDAAEKYIETIRGHGYRFVAGAQKIEYGAQVRTDRPAVSETLADVPVVRPQPENGEGQQKTFLSFIAEHRVLALCLTIMLSLLAGTGYYVFRSPANAITSVAVLPRPGRRTD